MKQAHTILIGAETYPPDINGAAQFGHRLATAMLGRGHEVHVVAASPMRGPSYRTTVEGGIVEHRLRSHLPPTHDTNRICIPWEIHFEVGHILDEVKPDVVHVQCHYIIGRALITQAHKRGIRVIATNHFMPANLDPFLPVPTPIKRVISKATWIDMRRCFSRAAVVTTPTQIGADAMRDLGGFTRPVMPVSNGIEIGDYELAEGATIDKAPGELRITFVGRLAQEKNIDVLIEALSLLPEHLNHVILDIAGGGELREELEKKAHDCGVSERVVFRGYVPDEDLPGVYQRADIFCQPGTAELQSLVSLEAMSASKPVVLANALALPHLVEDGVNGYLFEPNNARDLAHKLAAILSLPAAEREQMGRESRRIVNFHRADNTWRTFEELYVSDAPYDRFRHS
ncbi:MULTISPECIES: glycosyltransferase [Rothia]|jgi:group 1 glycosyl transferase|uniref:D-inositol 3-phosphate glycosyltransferase n=1 Tax=Rothia aeria TaxID=172042 RepID=A0A7Z9D6D1_9MICC|nr:MULTISPECIES: glycosyltransferase [Rothia]MDO4885162.1 glycosyltransferase [Rothia sp. (in: high G+C Gram-positive bacteria)]VEI22549.1 GDP-mannose-dependent alpha-(1-6)-phosphatidylinositol monomannoside mannosyltransferase [Rothia aeria]